MARGDDIEDRLINFAVRVVNLSSSLPSTAAGKHISGQILRSGTAPAAHYAEARSAESRRDFTHKLRIALKELNETRIWLEIIMRGKLLPSQRMEDILGETGELCRILQASINTVRSNHENE